MPEIRPIGASLPVWARSPPGSFGAGVVGAGAGVLPPPPPLWVGVGVGFPVWVGVGVGVGVGVDVPVSSAAVFAPRSNCPVVSVLSVRVFTLVRVCRGK
jgi:hypothetical protein